MAAIEPNTLKSSKTEEQYFKNETIWLIRYVGNLEIVQRVLNGYEYVNSQQWSRSEFGEALKNKLKKEFKNE